MFKMIFRSKACGYSSKRSKALTSTPKCSARGRRRSYGGRSDCEGRSDCDRHSKSSRKGKRNACHDLCRSVLQPSDVSDESLAELESSLLDEITRSQDDACQKGLPTFGCACSGFQCQCANERKRRPSSPRDTAKTSQSPSPRPSSPKPKHIVDSKNTECLNVGMSRGCEKRPGTPRPSPTPSCQSIHIASKSNKDSKSPSPCASASRKIHPYDKSKRSPQVPSCSSTPRKDHSPKRVKPTICKDSTLPCPAKVNPSVKVDSSATSSRHQKPPSEKSSKGVTNKNDSNNSQNKCGEKTEESSGIYGLLAKITAWSPIGGGSSDQGGQDSVEETCSVPLCAQRNRVSFQTDDEDLEQIFFNRGVKKSDASLEFEPCTSGECMESQQPDNPCDVDTCVAQNSTCPMERTDKPIPSTGSGGVCDAARAQHYYDKLMATLQILQNKEETVRVQTESLSVAEGRIATLTVRAQQLQRDLDQRHQEIKELKKKKDSKRKPSVETQSDEAGRSQRAMVTTLQKNISVIEELYRECFYENAKQEELIELLRKSYLDVRLMEREKVDRKRENNSTQSWTLKRCQEISADVENLKIEITNFINSSNNDSGMWTGSEDSAVTEQVGEDLQDITDQLLRLRDILTTNECTCGLKRENAKLKEENQNLRHESGDLQKRVSVLEEHVADKDSLITHYKKQLDDKAKELCRAQCEVSALKEQNADKENALKCLAKQTKDGEDCLKTKSAELSKLSQRCRDFECTITQLQQELAKADVIIKENCKIRSEVSYLTAQVSLWRSQLADSEARVRSVEEELMRARTHAQEMDECYREKACSAAALQQQLEAAHARGAELCGEARRVVCAVRHWVRRMRAKHADQERQIQQQAAVITSLNRQLSASCPGRVPLDARQAETSIGGNIGCARCHTKAEVDEETATCSAMQRLEMLSQSQGSSNAACEYRHACPEPCPAHASARRKQDGGQCDCEQDGGSQESLSSSRRKKHTVRKKTCTNEQCSARVRSGAIQRPIRNSTGRYFPDTCEPCEPRSLSPTDELYERVERLQVALVDGVRRWSRTRLPIPTRRP